MQFITFLVVHAVPPYFDAVFANSVVVGFSMGPMRCNLRRDFRTRVAPEEVPFLEEISGANPVARRGGHCSCDLKVLFNRYVNTLFTKAQRHFHLTPIIFVQKFHKMRVELFAGGNGGTVCALLLTVVQHIIARPSEPVFPQSGNPLLLKKITDEIPAQKAKQLLII